MIRRSFLAVLASIPFLGLPKRTRAQSGISDRVTDPKAREMLLTAARNPRLHGKLIASTNIFRGGFTDEPVEIGEMTYYPDGSEAGEVIAHTWGCPPPHRVTIAKFNRTTKTMRMGTLMTDLETA